MLNDAISKLKSTMITMVALLAFLFITVLKHNQDIFNLYAAEMGAFTYLLYNKTADDVEIPNDSDEENIAVTELHPGITIIPALATYNYALPIYFKYEYCPRDGLSRPVFTWNGWAAHVSADECPDDSQKTILYERYRDLRYEDRKATDIEGFRELNKAFRQPHGLNSLTAFDHEYVRLPYDRWITECVDLLRSDKKDELREVEPCDFEWNEISNATTEFASRYNTGITSIKLRLLRSNEISNTTMEFSSRHNTLTTPINLKLLESDEGIELEFNNQAFTDPNIDGEVLGVSAKDFHAQVLFAQITEDVSLQGIAKFYEETTGSSSSGLSSEELVDYIESEGRRLRTGDVDIPVIDIELPLPYLMLVLALFFVSLYGWSYFLATLIKEHYGEKIEVPWMLLMWSWSAESPVLHLFNRFLALFMTCCRASVFFLPGVFLLWLSIDIDNLSNQILLRSTEFRLIVGLSGAICLSMAILIYRIEYSLIRRILKDT